MGLTRYIHNNPFCNCCSRLATHTHTHTHTHTQVPQPFMDVVLHAGDALFIPAFWFHHVQVRTYSKKKMATAVPVLAKFCVENLQIII
jgi:hypothetical protein